MSLLTDAEFLQHQSYLGSGYLGLVQAERMLESGLALVVASNDRQVEIDLIQPYRLNFENMNTQNTANLLALATRALEGHVTDVTGQTLNDYLFSHGLQVSQAFADLSVILGAPINPANIEL